MKKEYWKLAFKNLKHRGLRSWLTLLGILIGVMAVVALIGLGNGLKAAVAAQFGISSTELITVQAGGLSAYGPPGSAVSNPLTINEVNEIKRIKNVEFAISRHIETVDVSFNKRRIFTYGTNIPYGEDRKKIYDILDVGVLKGKLLDDSDEGKVVLGNNFFTDKVGLDKAVEVGDAIEIKGSRFIVKGILEKEGSFIFDNIILMNENALIDLMDIDDEVDLIAVKLKDKDLMEKTKEDIEEVLRKERNVEKGEEDFEVSTPEAALETVNSIIVGVQAFIVIIALISVVVGAIGIINTMTTSVVERRKDIGIMKAIGAKNSQIFFQFFIESGLLGFIGGVFGAILGSLISILGVMVLNNFLGSELKPTVDFILIGLTLFGSFLVGAISGIWPAMSAAKQNPVEALRG